MSLSVQQFTLRDFFADPSQLVMARYQRHYEWTRHEMEQLLRDLAQAYEDGKARPDGGYHFFNSVIVFPAANNTFQVVDGQQRLTSLMLLLIAARDAARGRPVAVDLEQAIRYRGTTPRVSLHRGDDQTLAEFIMQPGTIAALPPPGRPGERAGVERLRVNAALAHAWINKFNAVDLGGIARFILNNTRFGRILVDSEDEAFRIFETVNSRGRQIAAEDVLRYALIDYATDDVAKRNELLERWDALEASIGLVRMKRFIAGWKTRAVAGEHKRGPLHRVIINTFGSPAEALALLEEELDRDISIFSEIDDADVAIADADAKQRIDASLVSMQLLQSDSRPRDWMPCAQAMISKLRDQPTVLESTIKALERFAWYHYMTSDSKGGSGPQRKNYADAMQAVLNGAAVERVVAPLALSFDEQSRMYAKFSGRIDNLWMPLRSLLVLLDMHLQNNGRRLDRSSLTIEHVLSMSSRRKAWQKDFGDDLDNVADYTLSIGNLCLVSPDINARLGDNIYATKRKTLIRYGVPKSSALAADIETNTEWTPAVIDARAERFRNKLCDIFGISPNARR